MSKPAASIGQAIAYRAEAALFFGFVGLFGLLGLKGASDFAGFLTRSIGPLTSVHARARRNLTRALPELRPYEAEHILKGMWDNLGRTMGELAHLRTFRDAGLGGRIEIVGQDIIERLKRDGRGAIFVSGHFANWELMAMIMCLLGLEGAEIYRAPNNPYVDAWLTRQRATYVVPKQIPKGPQGVRDLVSVLKAKGHVAMLVDQKMNDGIAVPFFGREAMTPAAAAQLSLRYDVPLVPASIVRHKGQKFTVQVHEPIAYRPTGNAAEDVYGLLLKINQFLEGRIKARPEEWLWVHKRWPD